MELRRLTYGSGASFETLWDEFVLGHPDATVGHLRATFALAEVQGALNSSILMIDEKDKVRAALPLFVVRSSTLRLVPVRTVTSGPEFPAHPLFDSSLSAKHRAEALSLLLAAVAEVASAHRADITAISYAPVIGGQVGLMKYHYLPLRSYGFEDANLVGFLLDLSLGVDELEKRLSPTCRNKIRRAKREGCVVRPIRDSSEWLQCRDLALQTLGGGADSVSAHQSIWNDFVLPGLARTYAVVSPASEMPSMVVVTVGWNGCWYYWKSFSDRSARVPGSGNLALWEAIVDSKSRGATFFELGSMEFGDPKQKAISDFKESFGGTPTYFLRGVRERRPIRHAAVQLLSALWQESRSLRRDTSGQAGSPPREDA